MLIQFQSSTPFRVEPVDGIVIINLDLYNRVLGYGKAQGSSLITPDPYQSDKYHISVRNVLNFQHSEKHDSYSVRCELQPSIILPR